MKNVLYILVIILSLSLSGCRSSKEIGENYVETSKEEILQESITNESETGEKNTREELEKETREELNKKTATKETEIEYFPPTVDNPQGGAKKSEKNIIRITDEQAIKESVEKAVKETEERYEKLLYKKESIIAAKDKTIEALRSELSKVDSRPIQGLEWFLFAFGIIGVVSLVIVCIVLYRKHNSKG